MENRMKSQARVTDVGENVVRVDHLTEADVERIAQSFNQFARPEAELQRIASAVADRIPAYLDPRKIHEAYAGMDDQELVEVGKDLKERTFDAWLRMCCIASILAERREGWLEVLSKEWELSKTRLSEMARIWRLIVVPMIEDGEAPPPVDVSYYHEALNAPDPPRFLKLAADLVAEGGFSVRKFRALVRQAKRSDAELVIEEAASPKSKLTASCKRCQLLQKLPNMQVEIVLSEGQRFPLVATVYACRVFGILNIETDWDHAARAEECDDFTP